MLVEGAGGLLVRFDDQGATLADAAGLLGAPVLVVDARRARHAQRDGTDRPGTAAAGAWTASAW